MDFSFSTAELLNFAKWIGIATLVLAIVTVFSFIFKWGIRFRLVGITAFTGVFNGRGFWFEFGFISSCSSSWGGAL